MLKELYIENLAVIKSAVIPFSENFNAFTGETGAGKSILINGINAVLGQRVTKDIVRSGSDKAVITGLFTDLSETVEKRLDELGISHDENEITVTREINADGGSVARINSRPATVSVLRELGEMLINIHGQHDNQILMAPERHIQILDSFGGDSSYLKDYQDSFRKLQAAAKKLAAIKKNRQTESERINYLRSVTEEIGETAPEEGEDTLIEEEYQMFRNSARILNALMTAGSAVQNEEEGISSRLLDAEGQLESVLGVYPTVAPLIERMRSARLELEDIASELSHCSALLEMDEETFSVVSQRRDELNSLKRRYNMDLDGIIDLYERSLEELGNIGYSDDVMAELEKEKSELLMLTTEKAKALYSYRSQTAERFVASVTEELKFLDMPNVVIQVRHEKGKLSASGMDSVEFLISANKGEDPKPISKIASGGELSRIMLALKTVIADKDDIPTMIFDEIDTGVSGRAAQKIGIKLQEISSHRQVLCVTHLSQIAVMADSHLLIEKKTEGDRTSTSVTKLDTDGRVREIARIMGGENTSDLMLESAREQLEISRRKK